MQKTLRLLIELQEIEKKVQSLVEQKAQTPIQIAALREEEKAADAQLSEKRKILESLSTSRRQLELEVEELEGQRAKSKQRLFEVKSNKEYQATLKEIDHLGELVRGREDQILEQMESAERIRNEILEKERVLAEARERLEREGAQLEMDAEMVARISYHNLIGVPVPVISVEDNIVFKAVLGRGPEVGKHDWEDVADMLRHHPNLDKV